MPSRYTITALGEVLWDVFPEGPRFGGAPANVACHAAALGADASLVSCVGKDELGEQALESLRRHDVSTQCIAVSPKHPTGRVQVELDAAGKPTFTIGQDVAWDHLEWSEATERLAARSDAVCFGTLGQREGDSRRVIQRFLATAPAKVFRVLDINLRPPFTAEPVIRQSLESANVLKLSDDELPLVAAACDVAGSEAEIIAALAVRYELRVIALTRGQRGATLICGPDRSDCDGVAVDVRDTVGAGDAFTAAMILSLLRGDPLDAMNQRACRVAAYVCSQSGATPPLPAELRDLGNPADAG
jgi:fructokinase